MSNIEWFLAGFAACHVLTIVVVFSLYFDLRRRVEVVEEYVHWH